MKKKKLSWLSYPDNKCNKLFGRFPFAMGMPCVLTHHIDRSDKKLLRGTPCCIHGMITSEAIPSGADYNMNTQPTLLVQCYDNYRKLRPATWQIGDLPPGVYPILPDTHTWSLDGNEIKRTQLPLSPAFASTIFSTQGQTIPKSKLDVNIPANMDVESAYVAFTRFKKADDVLIVEPFELSLVQRGGRLETSIFMVRFHVMHSFIH